MRHREHTTRTHRPRAGESDPTPADLRNRRVGFGHTSTPLLLPHPPHPPIPGLVEDKNINLWKDRGWNALGPPDLPMDRFS